MKLADYTADAICAAMGLVRFVEPAWSLADQPTLRVLLKPSFHPEVCLTLSPAPTGPALAIVALRQQFWDSPPLRDYARLQAEVPLSTESFGALIANFQLAYAAHCSGANSGLYLDGMSCEACLVSSRGTEFLGSQISHSAIEGLVKSVLEQAWAACRDPYIRNALATTASYEGLSYPHQDAPPLPEPTNIVILGPADDRQSLRDRLRASVQRKAAATATLHTP